MKLLILFSMFVKLNIINHRWLLFTVLDRTGLEEWFSTGWHCPPWSFWKTMGVLDLTVNGAVPLAGEGQAILPCAFSYMKSNFPMPEWICPDILQNGLRI